MSTIASPRASPRPSLTISSRRGSASTDVTTTSVSSRLAPQSAIERGSLRRNRAALRDYYNLKASDATSQQSSSPPTPSLEPEIESELDRPDFDVNTYVQQLLAREGLEGVLRVEAGLIGEIRTLDGEKKALVYDNYSKLIKATETIRSMREKMDPMMPGTGTLGAAVGHIAQTAKTLQGDLRKGHGVGVGDGREQQREVVRWVIGSPVRLRALRGAGKEEEAREQWERVKVVLEKWRGVEGVEDVRRRCTEVMQDDAVG